MTDGIRPAERPQPGGFDLSTFAPSLDAEAGESLGAFLEEFKSTEPSDLRRFYDALVSNLTFCRAQPEHAVIRTTAGCEAKETAKVLDLLDGMMRRETDLRALLAQAESSLNAIENLCALNPRLADGEVHHTAMWALAAVREGR